MFTARLGQLVSLARQQFPVAAVTLERFKALRRELLDPNIAEHRGRIADILASIAVGIVAVC